MSLVEVAKEMKKNAGEFEFQVRKGTVPSMFASPAKFFLEQERLKSSQKTIEIDGFSVRLTFTLDTLNDKTAWHLSIGREDCQVLPEEVVDKIVSTFFPGDSRSTGKIVEIPSLMHGKKVRQFLRMQED